MSRNFAMLLMIALCAAPGCYTVHFGSPQAAGAPSGTTIQTWTHSLFWGLIPLGEVSLDQCGDPGIKKMKSQIGLLGLIASSLTGGIWVPMHVKVVCAAPKAAQSDDPMWDDTYEAVADAPIADPAPEPLVFVEPVAE